MFIELLDKRIEAQQAEIERIKTTSAADLKDAEDRLALLQFARKKVTPEIDDLAGMLRKAGIWPAS